MSHAGSEKGSGRVLVVLGMQVVLILTLVLGAGALAGAIWTWRWNPPSGVVQSGEWVTGESGLRAEFSGTGLYVVVALATGLVVGVLVGLFLARAELLSLLVLLVAAIVAGFLMRHVGLSQSPPDPRTLAPDAPDGTPLPGALSLTGRAPLVSFPLGALVGYTLLLLVVPRRPIDPELRSEGADGPQPNLDAPPRDRSPHLFE